MVATDLNLTVETLKPKDELETGLAKKVKEIKGSATHGSEKS